MRFAHSEGVMDAATYRIIRLLTRYVLSYFQFAARFPNRARLGFRLPRTPHILTCSLCSSIAFQAARVSTLPFRTRVLHHPNIEEFILCELCADQRACRCAAQLASLGLRDRPMQYAEHYCIVTLTGLGNHRVYPVGLFYSFREPTRCSQLEGERVLSVVRA